MQQISGNPNAHTDARFAIVAGKFSRAISEKLVDGVRAEMAKRGVSAAQLRCVWVPGAFEIPLLCRKLAQSGDYHAIIALGAVIRGETAHFDYVAGECARGIAQLNLQGDVPIIFGVLTTETRAQAIARADPTAKNKGAELAVAALEMADLLRTL